MCVCVCVCVCDKMAGYIYTDAVTRKISVKMGAFFDGI